MKNHVRRAFLMLTAVLVLVTSLCGCGGDTPNATTPNDSSNTAVNTGEPSYGGSVVVGIAQDLGDSLDPHMSTAAGTREVLFNVFEGLVKPDSEGNIIPAVAESYEVTEGGKVYTFKLRDGVKFHNGDTVTVEDVVYSIKRCAGLLGDGEVLVAAFSVVESVEATDDSTVVVTLAEANTEFLAMFATLTASVIPADYADQATAPVGTGPFKYVSRSPQENFIMEKFADYWGEPAYLDRVEYKIITNPETLMMSLKSGAIDICAHLTSTQANELDTGVFYIEEDTMKLVQAVYLNNAAEPFDDIRVRQALSYAIDPQEIMAFTADGRGVEVGSSMYPAFTKYFMPELAEYYEPDVEKAKQLLKEAGYENGFEMSIMVPSDYTPHVEAAQVVVEQLKRVDITATLELVDFNTWYEQAYKNRDFQSCIVGLDASAMTARAMLDRYASDHGKNFINFSNAEYDETIAKAIACTDDAEQTQLYKRLQTILTEQAANAYIQDLCDLVAVKNTIGGLTFYPIYVLDMACIYYYA